MVQISIALDRYDRHFPFFDGTVEPPSDIDLKVFQVGQTVVLRDGEFRHERMLVDREFDVCEFSLSSYLMAKDRGLDITAVPVFPRRLFSPGLFYVRSDSLINTPRDLIGRRVGVNSFQTTLSVLARGDLQRVYGVPWKEITWCVANAEKVAFKSQHGVAIKNLGAGADLGLAMAEGMIDAFIHPHPPASVMGGQIAVRRLFSDAQREELRYYQSSGYFPIMHVMAMQSTLAESRPDVPLMVMNLFEQAKRISRGYFDDPNWSQLAWGRKYFEDERQLLAADVWSIGVRENEKNLCDFIEYMLDQGLISRRLTVDELFAPSTL